jgi:hypothetical protein
VYATSQSTAHHTLQVPASTHTSHCFFQVSITTRPDVDNKSNADNAEPLTLTSAVGTPSLTQLIHRCILPCLHAPLPAPDAAPDAIAVVHTPRPHNAPEMTTKYEQDGARIWNSKCLADELGPPHLLIHQHPF